jgi:hypothetical protein
MGLPARRRREAVAVTVTAHEQIVRRYGLDLIFRLTRYAMPEGLRPFRIELKPQTNPERWWDGTAFVHQSRIVIKIPCNHPAARYRAPLKFAGTPGSRGYQGVRVYSEREALLFILAHEIRHLWQKTTPRGDRVYGARGRYSERDADCYALGVVRRWRRNVPRGTIHWGTYRAQLEYVALPANKS